MAVEAPAPTPDAGTAPIAGDVAAGFTITSRPKATRVVSAHVSIKDRLVAIWEARELLFFLVRTQIKIKYKNSFLGLLWSMLSPALNLLVYSLVFGVLLHNGIPNFVIFLFAGLLLWNLFSTAVLTSTSVVVNNAGLVKKVAFPREILALAAVGSACVFFFQACVMVIFMVGFHEVPAWSLLWLVLVALVPTIVLASAFGLFFAAVNVYLRDVQHLVTVVVGAAWFWACPIVYSYQMVVVPRLVHHHAFQWLYFVNPVTPLVMTFQRVLYNRTGAVTLTNGVTHKHILPAWSTLTYVWADAAVLGAAAVLFYLARIVFGRLAGNFAEEL